MSLAKTSRPSASLIGRERLVATIVGAGAPLLWIAAPAGCGKTSLALEYVRREAGAVAWLRLDEADTDLASFIHFFAQSVCAEDAVDATWQMPELMREHLAAPAGYLRLFARSLSAHLKATACLVFDDAHLCQDARFFPQFLAILLDELPRTTRTLVLSRRAPPQGCARLQANGQMSEIDAESLKFSRDETALLLAIAGIDPTQRTRDSLYEYTHGWAAGISLAASWLRRRPDAIDKLDRHVSELVAGYLASEMFSAFSPTERDILMSVCWLPYFRAEWAAILGDGEEAVGILTRLAGQGALIYRYPGGQYTLHPLFARFLRDWAEVRVDEVRRRRWMGQGIDLLLDDGNVEDAIELALAHGAADRVAVLIGECADDLLSKARHQTLARWIERLPEQQRGPWHHFWLGSAQYVTNTGPARKSLLRAHELFSSAGNQEQACIALSLVVISYSFNGIAEQPLKAVLARFVDPGADFAALASAEMRAHLALGIYSGLSTTDPGHPDLPLWESRTLAGLSDPAVSAGTKVRLATWASIHLFFSGRYRRLAALRVLFDQLVDGEKAPSYQRYLLWFLRLFDELVRGDLGILAETYAASRRSAEDTGFANMNGHYALHFACSRMLSGDSAACHQILAKVAADLPAGYFNLAGHLRGLQCWQAAVDGDAEATAYFAERTREAGEGFGSVPYEIWGLVGSAVSLALSGSPKLAMAVMQLRQRGAESDYPIAGIHAELLDAWSRVQADDEAGAIPFLEAGLRRLGQESEGFLWGAAPRVLQPLCALALRRGIEVEAARSLIRVFRLPPPDEAPDSWPWPLEIRCFGGFELLIDGDPLRSRGKSKHRQLDLLKFVAAHAPAAVPLARIAEALWPDSDGDTAKHALETTLSRLRTTLGRDTMLVERGTVALDLSICRVDTVLLDRALERLENAIEGSCSFADALLGLYRGELLAGVQAPWAVVRREYWRGRLARTLTTVAKRLAADDHYAEASRLLEHALVAEPHSEPLTAALMELCLRAGRFAEGLAAYRRYRRLALSVLGAPPAVEIEALAERLLFGRP